MTDDDLVKLGFAHVDDGVFLAPPSADLRFLPCDRYYEIRIAIGDGNIISVVCLGPSCLDRPSRGQPHPRSGITAAPARASATDCVRTRLARPACPNRPRLDGDISGKYGR